MLSSFVLSVNAFNKFYFEFSVNNENNIAVFFFVLIFLFFSVSNGSAVEAVGGVAHANHVLANAILSLEKLTEKKHFKARLNSNIQTPPLHKIHSWTLHLETIEGSPVENAKIVIYGGMPANEHGYSTNPQVRKYLGNGNYLVEGIKFSMSGYWEMWFNIRSRGKHDKVIFGLNIAPPDHVKKQLKNITSSYWSHSDLSSLSDLWIKNLPALPDDPSNRVANDIKAAGFGKKLFFDPRLSANGKISCASCHDPVLFFTDGKALSAGVGITRRGAPGLLGISHSPWFFWDGRADSQWAQALGPLEDASEHAGSRGQYANLIQQDKEYKNNYEAIFGELPDMSDESRFP